MQTIRMVDGRKVLYQWDTGVRIKVHGCDNVDQMHFVTPAGIISRELVDGECDIPDAALQTAGLLKIYAFDRTENGRVTRCEFLLKIKERPKPVDYIDPPDEYDNLSELANRIAPLIAGGGGDATGAIRYDLPQILTEEEKAQARSNLGIVAYTGEYSITPSATSEVTLQTAQKLMDADVHVQKIPYYNVSNNSGGETAYIANEV